MRLAALWLLAALPTAYFLSRVLSGHSLATLDDWLLFYPLAIMLNLIGGTGGYAVGVGYLGKSGGERIPTEEVLRLCTIGAVAIGVWCAFLLVARGSNL
jgi:hypothetical protein